MCGAERRATNTSPDKATPKTTIMGASNKTFLVFFINFLHSRYRRDHVFMGSVIYEKDKSILLHKYTGTGAQCSDPELLSEMSYTRARQGRVGWMWIGIQSTKPSLPHTYMIGKCRLKSIGSMGSRLPPVRTGKVGGKASREVFIHR